MAIGKAVVVFDNLRERCVVTTWDPETVTQDVDVLRHINASFDGSLALNAWAGRSGTVAVGDRARVLELPADVAYPQSGRFRSVVPSADVSS